MQIEKAGRRDCLHISKAYFLTVSITFSVYKQNFTTQ